MAERLSFTKGHGTENDFVLVPDLDGTLGLSSSLAVALADRRTGVGGDGVIRVVPTELVEDAEVRAQARGATWFMDYRNADGSLSEMCGNGTRVFAAFLRREGLETADEFSIATRAGVKHVRRDGEGFAVDLGPWRLGDAESAERDGFDALVHLDGGDPYSALTVDLGNPHTVVALPEQVELDTIDLTAAPAVRPDPPQGTNVELVRPMGPGHVALRVHERGVGETRSCGSARAPPPSPRASGRARWTPARPGSSTCRGAGSPSGSWLSTVSSWPVPRCSSPTASSTRRPFGSRRGPDVPGGVRWP